MAARRVSRGRHWRRRAIALGILAVGLLAGYFLWLRDSSLVEVEEVEVKGATTNAEQITAALTSAAEGMTTLHIDDDALRDAVTGFPTVASVSADSSLPHSLTITVTERLSVAQVSVAGERLGVSADAYILRGVNIEGAKLPPIEATEESGRLDPDGAAQAAILGAAPSELREEISEATWDDERGGVVVELSGAPELRFGDGSQAEEKWRAVAAVLTDPDYDARSYLDVSVPERAVAGG
jgi:cell division protein FtsQ